jgi:hypothetical protein
MELTFAGNCECCQLLGIFVQWHLPESRSEVQCCENGGVGSSSVADTFGDLLHGVLINVGVLVQFPEVLYNRSPWPCFFGTQKMGEL